MITAVAQTLADILVEGSSLIRTSQIDLSHPYHRRDIRPALSLYLYDLRASQSNSRNLRTRGLSQFQNLPVPEISNRGATPARKPRHGNEIRCGLTGDSPATRPEMSVFPQPALTAECGQPQAPDFKSGERLTFGKPEQLSAKNGCSQKSIGFNAKVFWYDLSFAIIPWDWTNLGEQRLLSEALLLLLQQSSIKEEKLPLELRGYGGLPLKIATPKINIVQLWSAFKTPLKPALYVTVQAPMEIPVDNIASFMV